MTAKSTLLFACQFILACTLFSFSSKAIAQTTVTRYHVQVPVEFINKQNLSNATDAISNRGRFLTSDGFYLDLQQADADDYVKSLFETAGIPVISINGSKQTVADLPKAGGVDCGAAQILCSNTSQTANSSGHGTQELNSSNRGCLAGNEHQSSWYYLNIQTAGSLDMLINPNSSSDDYDFAIWGPFTDVTAAANCPPVSGPIRCSWSACEGQTGIGSGQGCWSCGFLGLFTCTGGVTGSGNSENDGGDSWVSSLNVNPSEIYILLVDNYSNSGNAYNMSFSGSAVLGCTPVVLPVELSSFSAEKTSSGNLLNWTTQSEDRSAYFTVEWTTNPASENWLEIGKIYGQGHSETIHDYQLAHVSPSKETVNYYRLVLTDMDGGRTIYNDRMIAVNNELESLKIEHIYNSIGQEVDQYYHGLVIYQYSDGTTRKVFQ